MKQHRKIPTAVWSIIRPVSKYVPAYKPMRKSADVGPMVFISLRQKLIHATEADAMVTEYNHRLEILAEEYRSIADPQFAVSYQPGFARFPVAKYKQSYLSGFDWYVLLKKKKEKIFRFVPY